MLIASFSIKASKSIHLHHYLSEKMEISEVLAFFGTPQNYQVLQLGQLLILGAKTCNEHNSVIS